VGDPCENLVGECAGGVKQCTMGAIVCSRPPMAESCDGKDNNCNGVNDDGDPGGGAACGTNAGECSAGVKHCVGGAIACEGAIGTIGGAPEICNGKDDDCDTKFDEGLTDLGSCGGPNVGECHTGTLSCIGGGPVCGDSPAPAPPEQGPQFELCDNLDNDCDTRFDELYNKATDPRNCGACNNVCAEPHANMGCAASVCVIASCQPGWHNLNGVTGDGCEYGGPSGMGCFPQGSEVCNGEDDDCNGTTDVGITAPANLCKTGGPCTGATATCQGANGWRCNYGATVSTDGMGNVIPETACDNIDNDCDIAVDENQPNKGQACNDGGTGECRGQGTFTCNAAMNTGPAVCTITTPGTRGTCSNNAAVMCATNAACGTGNTCNFPAEICDGLDNNCNGAIDDGSATGNLIGQNWVAMGNGRQIMKYEASRPDATSLEQGVSTATTCSRAGSIPWTNVTYPQAVAACTAVGARLCTESEWHRTCSVVASTTYPVVIPTGTQNRTFEAEDYFAISSAIDTVPNPDVRHAWTPDYTAGFFGVSAMVASANTGSNITSTTTALTESPRLDYQLNFAAAGNYRVCVRGWATSDADDDVLVGISPTAPGVAANLRTLAQSADDTWQWMGPSATIAVAAGTNLLSVYMQTDGFRIDRVYVTTDNACPTNANPPAGSAGNKWAYEATPNTFQPGVCNSEELDADLPPATAGDQDDILPSSAGMCYANNGTNDTFDMSGNVKEWT
ncbi:MAG: hypothetical protein H0T79_12420, partial [Deltaproteobacteria bacterium]|nr:hypothetical protein [Deltaproteobacteria bacterium]